MRTLLCAELAEGRLLLDAAESHHLLHVLRATPGTALRVGDGQGRQADAQLVGVRDHRAEVQVGPVTLAPPPPARIVLLGAPKPALVEEAATLATEAGASALWIVASQRAHPGNVRLERLERVLDTAVKQCRRPTRPTLATFPSLPAALGALDALPEADTFARFVAHPGGAGPPRQGVAAGAALAIGPEGGWNPAELAALQGTGFQPLGLGPHILRAPTAVVAGLTALAVGQLSGW